MVKDLGGGGLLSSQIDTFSPATRGFKKQPLAALTGLSAVGIIGLERGGGWESLLAISNIFMALLLSWNCVITM